MISLSAGKNLGEKRDGEETAEEKRLRKAKIKADQRVRWPAKLLSTRLAFPFVRVISIVAALSSVAFISLLASVFVLEFVYFLHFLCFLPFPPFVRVILIVAALSSVPSISLLAFDFVLEFVSFLRLLRFLPSADQGGPESESSHKGVVFTPLLLCFLLVRVPFLLASCFRVVPLFFFSFLLYLSFVLLHNIPSLVRVCLISLFNFLFPFWTCIFCLFFFFCAFHLILPTSRDTSHREETLR